MERRRRRWDVWRDRRGKRGLVVREGCGGGVRRGELEVKVCGIEIQDLVLFDESDFNLFLCGGKVFRSGQVIKRNDPRTWFGDGGFVLGERIGSDRKMRKSDGGHGCGLVMIVVLVDDLL